MFEHCIASVQSQKERDFEHIVIDDGSKDKDWQSKINVPPVFDRLIKKPHEERYIGYNTGLKESKGEWICFLDSDDAYSPYYLQAVSQMIKQYPEYKMFNFGSVHFHQNYKVSLKQVFRPALKDVGHIAFKSGGIVNGTYVFHRSVYEDLGGIPNVTNPWDFSVELAKEHPEIRPFYEYQKENGDVVLREVGNPYGQDWAFFFKYTRKYHSKPIEAYLYHVYSKHGYQLPLEENEPPN
jgi:glycosyltransferase involved in cell wall biosynthesis